MVNGCIRKTKRRPNILTDEVIIVERFDSLMSETHKKLYMNVFVCVCSGMVER